MPVDDPALLGMPDIELLGIIRVMCETIDNKTTGKKFDVQIGIEQTVKITEQTGTHRQSQMKIAKVKKETYHIILIPAQANLI